MDKLTDTDFEVVLSMADNDMNPTRTANKMFMNRNTVIYHIRKVKKLTGLDARNFYDLIKLVRMARSRG